MWTYLKRRFAFARVRLNKWLESKAERFVAKYWMSPAMFFVAASLNGAIFLSIALDNGRPAWWQSVTGVLFGVNTVVCFVSFFSSWSQRFKSPEDDDDRQP